jgi:hypothetical protein
MSDVPVKQNQTQEKTKKRKGCFFWGCLTTLGIIVILAIVLSITIFKVPQKIGLVKPATERLLSQTPDRETAATLKAELQKTGISMTGVDIYVIPEKKSDGKSVMLAVLDSSKGFYFSNTGSQDPISDYLIQLAETISSYGVERVAFSYLDSKGEPIANVTAPTDAILKYAQGKISKTEFFKTISLKIDIKQFATSGLP